MSSNAIDFAPLVDALTPILVQVAAVVITGAIAWAATRFSKATGIDIQKSALDQITKAANSEAGAWIAAGDTALVANAKIDVGSPAVNAIASRIVASLPVAMKDAGITPDHVRTIVAGEIGKLQASMASVAPLTAK